MNLGTWDATKSYGKGFNLIRALRDHGPARITQIDQECAILQGKIDGLRHEQLALHAVLDSLERAPRRGAA